MATDIHTHAAACSDPDCTMPRLPVDSLDALRAAALNVLHKAIEPLRAYRAEPPEYPGHTLVPLADMERLESAVYSAMAFEDGAALRAGQRSPRNDEPRAAIVEARHAVKRAIGSAKSARPADHEVIGTLERTREWLDDLLGENDDPEEGSSKRPEPRCSECGVPIAEHPDTDACAIAQESGSSKPEAEKP